MIRLVLEYYLMDSDGNKGPLRCVEDWVPDGLRTDCDDLLVTVTQQGCDIDWASASNAGAFDPEAVSAERWQVVVCAKKALMVESCRLVAGHDFSRDDAVLFNGYQSWTDTHERVPRDTMRALQGLPLAIVDRWKLDGSGDYRFTEYPLRPGAQHGWTYGYARGSYGCILVGSLDESQGFTLLQMEAQERLAWADREQPLGSLQPGDSYVALDLATVRAAATCDDPVDAAFQAWFMVSGVNALPAPLLTGYTSWYRHYGDIDAEALSRDLAGAKQAFGRLDTTGFCPLFQIDDGYAKIGDWLDYRQDRFPQGLAPLAAEIVEAGFMPGIWVAPFVCEAESTLMTQHPDWVMRDERGVMVAAGSHWSGSYALDTRNPEVREYVTTVLRTITQEWGFRLLKLDFLYSACMVPHDGMNRGQLMADAVDLIRAAVGSGVMLLGCGVPLGSVFGKMEYCRVGCDVGLDWDGKLYMRVTERERVSTRRSIANTVCRGPLNGRAFANDPDVVFLRDDVGLTQQQRNMLLDGNACFGSVLLTSDDMGVWNNQQIDQFQFALELMREARKR